MNILCDRHHAGLLYSLQLLFEDRLGMDLYIPIGHEWWDEAYWRFGIVFGDDRLAQQYLIPHHRWTMAERGLWRTTDVEFPERGIFGVTLEQARDMEWEFTCATVQENQAGFDRFAKEKGARSVYQVGNRGQYIDWSLDPLVIASAEAEIHGRGIVYHQEYSKDSTFKFVDPARADIHQVRCYVNCFDRMPKEWAEFQEIERLLPDFQFFLHGHDGREGLVHPTTAIAVTMAAAGWGYHDKPQGDGFGHVIHYWASIGRPLIGNAKYYNGLMPGPLWEDGVTCVDLGTGTTLDNARMIESIAEDPERHAMMCRAIRGRLDELVDFDAEEQKIRALLSL